MFVEQYHLAIVDDTMIIYLFQFVKAWQWNIFSPIVVSTHTKEVLVLCSLPFVSNQTFLYKNLSNYARNGFQTNISDWKGIETRTFIMLRYD